MAEGMADKFKANLKVQKEKLKEKDTQIAQLKEDIERMQTEFEEVRGQNVSIIDQFGEISKDLDFDKNTSILDNIK